MVFAQLFIQLRFTSVRKARPLATFDRTNTMDHHIGLGNISKKWIHTNGETLMTEIKVKQVAKKHKKSSKNNPKEGMKRVELAEVKQETQ